MRFSQSTNLLMCLSLETLTSRIRTDKPSVLCYNLLIWNDLTQMVNFRTQIPDSESLSLVCLDLFISSETNIFLQCFSVRWKLFIMLLFQFPLTFCQTQKGMPHSLYSVWLFSCWLGQFLWSLERPLRGEYL